MKKMNNEQINVLNHLLKDNGDTLTAFYDETLHQGLSVGLKYGVISGVIISVVGTLSLFGVKSIIKNNIKER